MEKHDTIIDQMSELLKSFKGAQIENLRFTTATHGIVDANYLRRHGDDEATNRLEREYMCQFENMSTRPTRCVARHRE